MKVSQKDITTANAAGLKHRDGSASWSYYTPVLQMAYNLGLDGVNLSDAPVVSGYRYGKVSEHGLSFNYADQKTEKGLSLAAIDGQPECSSVIWFRDRAKVAVSGVLLPLTGSDNEPLILPVGVIDNND